MSQENVEIVRAAVEAINRGDTDALFKDAAPDIELDASRAIGPLHGVFYGVDEAPRAWAEFSEPWACQRFEVEAFIEAGDDVAMPFTNYLRGRDGIEAQARVAYLWTIHDGAVVRVVFHQSRQEALEAVGLSE